MNNAQLLSLMFIDNNLINNNLSLQVVFLVRISLVLTVVWICKRKWNILKFVFFTYLYISAAAACSLLNLKITKFIIRNVQLYKLYYKLCRLVKSIQKSKRYQTMHNSHFFKTIDNLCKIHFKTSNVFVRKYIPENMRKHKWVWKTMWNMEMWSLNKYLINRNWLLVLYSYYLIPISLQTDSVNFIYNNHRN